MSLLMARRRALAAFERVYIVRCLRRHRGDLAKAAREAMLSAKNLQALMHRYQIHQHEYDPPGRPYLVWSRSPGAK